MIRIAAKPYAFLRTRWPAVEKISTILKASLGHNDVVNGLSISVCNRPLVDGTFSHPAPRIHIGTGICRPSSNGGAAATRELRMANWKIPGILAGPSRALGLAQLLTDYQLLWQPKGLPDVATHVPPPRSEKPIGAVHNPRQGASWLLMRLGLQRHGRLGTGTGPVYLDNFSLPATAKTIEHPRVEAVPKNAPGGAPIQPPKVTAERFQREQADAVAGKPSEESERTPRQSAAAKQAYSRRLNMLICMQRMNAVDVYSRRLL
jgi:hypothetical protein